MKVSLNHQTVPRRASSHILETVIVWRMA